MGSDGRKRVEIKVCDFVTQNYFLRQLELTIHQS